MTFEDFKKMAKNSSLSHREKIGFSDQHRAKTEHNIFPYICKTLIDPMLPKCLRGGGQDL